MSIHNDGWQKQGSIARNIADRGQQALKQDAKAEKSQASKLLQALQGHTKAPDAASTAATSEAARQPVQAGKDVPQTLQRTRAEVQDLAARQDITANRAGKEYIDAKRSAADLQAKVLKAPDTATAEAVKQKGQLDQTNVTRQNPQQPGAVVVAHAAHQAPQPAARRPADAPRTPTKGKEGAEEKRGPEGQSPALTAKTPGAEAQGAGAAAAASAFKLVDAASERAAVGEGREKDSASEEEGGEKRPASRSGSGVAALGSGKAREFNALLGGHAGSGGEGGGDGSEGTDGLVPVDEGARAPDDETLLDRDTGFRVYSEFDELAPGIEIVKREAQRFSKFVEKKFVETRLVEIARLDSDLDLAIMSISQRIVVAPGSDPALVQAVKDGISLRKSVYGGMIG